MLQLGDNLFKAQDARVLVRAVANKGLRGVFRSLHLGGLALGRDALTEVRED